MNMPKPSLAGLKPVAAAAVLAILTRSASAGVQWRELGPAPTLDDGREFVGRISAAVCSPTDSDVYWIAAADGGVWRTTDGGRSWTPLTDDLPTSAIGALALDPADENVLYAGSGEANFANHSRYGLGLFKSLDGGLTWTQLAEQTFAGRCFSSLVVSPRDPQVLFAGITRAGGFPEMAAARQHPGATGPVGVFRSVDGGVTWQHLTNGLPALSATSVGLDPADPDTIYAGIGHIFGDPDNGIYKSEDGGESWSRLAGGLPGDWANIGRITVAVAPSLPSRVYALITNAADAAGGNATVRGAYRSDDFGATWTQLTALGTSLQATYGWYLSVITVEPNNPDVVFMGGVDLRRSLDAGATFQTVTPPHVDIHALAWDASGRLVCGDDGGVHRTSDLGASWTALNDGLGVIQLYAGLSTHPQDDNVIFAGAQDNGSNARRDDSLEWEHVQGGDGGWTQIAPAVPRRWYCEFQGTGNLFRSNNSGDTWVGARAGIPFSDRNCFLPPYQIDLSSTNNVRMLYATHRIFETLNRGDNWTPISDDLTKGAGAIRALAIAPSNSQVVYIATNDGNVQRSDDGGFTWTLLLDDNPGWPRVTREICVDPADALTVYLAGAVFGAPKVRRSTDGGQTWTVLDGDLPDVPVNVIAVDSRTSPPVLYAGSDAGVFRTIDGGASWRPYGAGLPTAAVIDLVLEPARNRLVAGTQGRGAWEAPAGVPGDLDFDGDIDVFDLSTVFQSLGCVGELCSGDADGDGDTDVADLSLLLSRFGLPF